MESVSLPYGPHVPKQWCEMKDVRVRVCSKAKTRSDEGEMLSLCPSRRKHQKIALNDQGNTEY